VSALTLHSQLETSNRFLEIVTILQGDELECPDQPRPGAAVHRPRPGRAAPRHRGRPGQHRAQRLRHRHRPDRSRLPGEAGRRPPQPLPEAAAADAAAVLEDDRYFGPDAPGGGEGDLSPAFVIRVRDHRPVMASRPGPARRAQWRGSAGGAGCLPGLGRPVRGEARVVSGDSGCESGGEDAGASGTLNRAACGPAWLAAADHRASPSSPGWHAVRAASAHAPVTRAAGVPAAGCAGQPRPDG
jgi:hypothetical protein